jgi:translation elongation factor P/translation initiation factor 5A
MQYLYGDGELVHVHEHGDLRPDRGADSLIEEALPYLKESDEVQVVAYGDEALGVELPAAWS